ncbi:PspC domain-containing protein [uncultured Eubacterium sp.]|uniref:PspC domain-containing protein n=1 Tax=uncultured Eubacterium sp. TaxID=165185 RepID=UPI0015AF2A64|nr:PspC domain-containing protein [uncultured Eubacterium sp.]
MGKKLYKSTTDRKLCGVCGGLAEYLNVDSTIVRLIWALVVCAGGAGVLAYIICALVIPDEPSQPFNQEQDPYYSPTNVDND